MVIVASEFVVIVALAIFSSFVSSITTAVTALRAVKATQNKRTGPTSTPQKPFQWLKRRCFVFSSKPWV